MAFDARQEPAKDGCQHEGEQGNGDRGDDNPEEEGVPLLEPELAGEGQRMFARGMEELVC